MQVTCFSDSEEKIVGKDHIVQFMPEARLKELGGLYEKVGLVWLLMHPEDASMQASRQIGAVLA